jgi:hypothetical protein
MKKYLPTALLGLAFVLTACPGPTTPQLSVSNVTFTSELQDSTNKSFICNDDLTPVTVAFQYTGDLGSWDVEFVGASGQKGAKQSFTYGGSNYTENTSTRTITMNYVLAAGTAPLSLGSQVGPSVAPGVQPQAITVVPVPRQIGTTKLLLTVRNSAGQSATKEVGSLPVIENCKSVAPGTNLAVFNVKFTSEFRDNAGKSYICYNEPTVLSLSFQYQGDLASWVVRYKGATSGDISETYLKSETTKYVENPPGTINFQKSFFINVSPFAARQKADPQAIVVVPVPSVKGSVTVTMTVSNSAGKTATETLANLPVIDNCPAP